MALSSCLCFIIIFRSDFSEGIASPTEDGAKSPHEETILYSYSACLHLSYFYSCRPQNHQIPPLYMQTPLYHSSQDATPQHFIRLCQDYTENIFKGYHVSGTYPTTHFCSDFTSPQTTRMEPTEETKYEHKQCLYFILQLPCTIKKKKKKRINDTTKQKFRLLCL